MQEQPLGSPILSIRLIPYSPSPLPAASPGDAILSPSPVAPPAPLPSIDCTGSCLAYAVGKVAAAAPEVLPAGQLCGDAAGQGYFEQCLTWSGPDCRGTLNDIASGARTQYVAGCPSVTNLTKPSPTEKPPPSPTPAAVTPAPTPNPPTAATQSPSFPSSFAAKPSSTSVTRPTLSSLISATSTTSPFTTTPAAETHTLAPLPTLPLSTATNGASTTSLSDSALAGSRPSLAVVSAIGVAIGLLVVALIILGLHLRARRRAKAYAGTRNPYPDYIGPPTIESLEQAGPVVDDTTPSTAAPLAAGMLSTAAAEADDPAPQRPRKAAARTNPAVQSWLRAGAAAAAGNNVNGLLGTGNGNHAGESAASSRHGSAGSAESAGWRDSLDDVPGVGAPYRDLLPAAAERDSGPGDGIAPLVQTSAVRQVWDATAWCEINISPAMRVEAWAALADGWCVVMWAGNDDEPPQTGLVPTTALVRAPPSRPLTRAAFLAHPSHMSALPTYGPRAARAKRDFYIRALASGLLTPTARRPWANELARGASATASNDGSSGRDSAGSGPAASRDRYNTRTGGLAGRMSADGRVVVGEGRESFGVPPRRAAGLMGRIRSGESLHSAFIPKDQW
ncbi:hypothetical protein HDU87_003914 [Geranomyces variabilis]|uniref:Uncharacterized protein n=1 Tax=Geranomyces variabilis TaxID=109894 RepID=A0AAD5XQX0_9FUNG|nr:hypothetical protein HDU87_003914 [Geranomyces variabilis]